jgi:transposase
MQKSKAQTLSAATRISVGIDISSKTFNVTVSGLLNSNLIHKFGSTKFNNTLDGFIKLLLWLKKCLQMEDLTSVRFIMEATGVYYEELAYYLHELGLQVFIVQPNHTKNYFKSDSQRSKTDTIDAQKLAQFGIEKRQLSPWKPFSKTMLEIKKLTRLREDLEKMKTAQVNRREAVKREAHRSELALEILEQSIQALEEQIQKIDNELHLIVSSDQELKQTIDNLDSIEGVGFLTACVILSEYNGFVTFNNKRQVISHAGLDIPQNSSGTSVNGRTRISKRGNAHVRRIFYNPARHYKNKNKEAGALFDRLGKDKPGIVAVSRKLLVLMFTLVKYDRVYDPNFKVNEAQRKLADTAGKGN